MSNKNHINSDLIKEAKKNNINTTNIDEKTLTELIKQEKTKQWQEENKEAIEKYNESVRKNGIFNHDKRMF